MGNRLIARTSRTCVFTRMNGNQSLRRAFQVLEYVTDHPGTRCKEVSVAIGLANSTVARFLADLEQLGYLRCERNHWRAGARLAGLGRGFMPRDAAATIQAELAELSDSTGLTAFFVACDQDEAVYVHRSMSVRTSLASTKRIGARAPLYCTGVGKVFLAARSDEAVREYAGRTPLLPFTPRTATSAGELLERVRAARRDGWATDDEECELGLRCLAVPVALPGAAVKSALSISGPKASLEIVPSPAQLTALRRAAEAIAPIAELGAW